MTGRFNRAVLTALLSTAILSGCTGATIKPSFYTLIPEHGGDRPVSLSTRSADLTLGLWPVKISDVLDRTGIVSYAADHQVVISDRHHWAGALDKNIERLLTAELINALGEQSVLNFPWDRDAKPDYELKVQIETLAGPLDGPVELSIHWTLEKADGQAAKSRRAVYSEPVTDAGYAGYVAAINRVVQRFSVDLAELLKAL